MILALLVIAPTLQIIASILRIKGHTVVPIGGIMLLALILGIICSFWAMDSMPVPPQLHPGPRCGMAEGAVLMGGIFLQMATAPLIAIISYILYYFKQLNNRKLNTI
ncbi:hypothetical protein [Mucilaginibacter dorajii]|uniref:hypothetical protein n=1 Tax=Mucilaginibacter dorajii TaxID=692994 RepID=UPI002168DA88|nr:hypothetical protein [Mucilaginibacter dorajii]MCS3733475.1 magnesium-transporting ATPase (P-type) [Mucilaginibacter dorajii]